MPLVPAKCTQCGSSLTVESSQDAAVCPFCKIFGVIHLIIVMPTISSYKNSIKKLNNELKAIETEYDNENNKIKTKYKMERNKIDAEKLKIEEKSSEIVYMKKIICPLCGYVHEGYSAPEKCPVCTCSAEKFKEMEILSFR